MDEAELRRMSPAERQQLAAMLVKLDGPRPDEPVPPEPYLPDPALGRQRRLILLISAASCVILAGWIVVLAATLPRHFNAHHWRALWVNYDVILFAVFAATAWATWRRRQLLILLLMVIGTMLCCDAWFDIGTSLATNSMWLSIASALFAELPLAYLAFAVARRLLKATIEIDMTAPAETGDQPAGGWRPAEGTDRTYGPSLRRTPLAGAGLEEVFSRVRALDRAERTKRTRQSADAE